jgi:hypothetical protein
MTAERRESMLLAAESALGFENLRALVKSYLDDGTSADQLLEDLDQIRALVPEETEEFIMDVMDLLTGWCAPQARLMPPAKDASTPPKPH